MSIRGARMLVAGACSPLGQRLVEAFLALGAHVVAADGLRTRLEELRAQMRQHERLWVAECDFDNLRAARKLLDDVVRDEPLDTAIIVAGVAADVEAAAAGCESFLDAVIEVQARSGRGRVLIAIAKIAPALRDGSTIAGAQVGDAPLIGIAPALRGGASVLASAPPPAFLPLLAAAVPRAAQHGIAVGAAIVELERPAALARMMALCDPERPAASGWIAVP